MLIYNERHLQIVLRRYARQVVSGGVVVKVRPQLVGELIPVQPVRRFQRQQLDQRLRLAQSKPRQPQGASAGLRRMRLTRRAVVPVAPRSAFAGFRFHRM
jgi:hypothetical protein